MLFIPLCFFLSLYGNRASDLFLTPSSCVRPNPVPLSQINKVTFGKIEENKDNKTRSPSPDCPNSSAKGRAAIVFSLKNEVGGLVKALKLFQVITQMLNSSIPSPPTPCDNPPESSRRHSYLSAAPPSPSPRPPLHACFVSHLCRTNTSTWSTSSPANPSAGIQTLRSLWIATATTSSSRS